MAPGGRLLIAVVLIASIGLAAACGGGGGGGGAKPRIQSRTLLAADGALEVDFSATAATFGPGAQINYRHTLAENGTELAPALGFEGGEAALEPAAIYALSNGGSLYVGGSYAKPVFYYLGHPAPVVLRLCTEAEQPASGRSARRRCQEVALDPMSDLEQAPARVSSTQETGEDNSIAVDFSPTAACLAYPGAREYRHTLYEGETALAPTLGFARHDAAVGDFQVYALAGGGTLFVGGSYEQPVFYYIGGAARATLRLCTQAADGRGIVTAARCQTLELAELSERSALAIYAVRVEVTDLDGELTLQNNGGDDLTLSADGTHAFATRLAPGAAYDVNVRRLVGENYFQECRLTGASGTIGHADVTVHVDCPEPFVIGKGNLLNGIFNPLGVTVDREGNIYAAQDAAGTVTQHNPQGHLVLEFSGAAPGDTLSPVLYDTAFDSGRNLYVADSANHAIKVFDANGVYLRRFGSSGTGDGQFNAPVGIFIDSADTVYVTDQLNHRIQVFAADGTFLRKFGSNGTGNGQFNTPNKLWVDSSGRIYVADTLNNRVQIFDANGNFLRKFGTAGSADGQFNRLWGVAVAGNGNILTAEREGSRVQVFDSTGNFIAKFAAQTAARNENFVWAYDIVFQANGDVLVADAEGLKQFTPAGAPVMSVMLNGPGDGEFQGGEFLLVDAENIFAADCENHRVQVFDREGRFVRKFGTYGSGDGQFSRPFGVALDPLGRLYVTDWDNRRVQVFDRSGNFRFKFGSQGYANGQFQWPAGIEVSPGGEVFVSDNGRNDIQVFDSAGNFLRKFGAPGTGNGQFNWPMDIAQFSNGDIAVADYKNHRVQVFDRLGNFLWKFGSYGSGDGQFNRPYGIHIDNADRIYVAEYRNFRIQVFDPNGTFLFKFGGPGNRPGGFRAPGGVSVSPEMEEIFVFDYSNHTIQVFDMQGNSIMR